MIVKLAKYLVSWQVTKGYLPKEKENLYTYAYELLFGQAVNLLIACLLAILFHAYLIVLVFLIAYIPLRSYAGGHHADTYLRCTIISALFIGAACIIIKMIPMEYVKWIILFGAGITGGVIFLFAPVPDYNKPLEPTEIVRYRRCSRAIWLVETLLCIICYVVGLLTISATIVFGQISLSVLLCLGILKNNYLSGRSRPSKQE